MSQIKKIVKYTLGVVLVLLGLAALLTPLSPGSWLIPIGLEFLGLRLLLENKLWQWTESRPNSKVSRGVRRILCLRPRDAEGQLKCRRIRRHDAKASQQGDHVCEADGHSRDAE